MRGAKFVASLHRFSQQDGTITALTSYSSEFFIGTSLGVVYRFTIECKGANEREIMTVCTCFSDIRASYRFSQQPSGTDCGKEVNSPALTRKKAIDKLEHSPSRALLFVLIAPELYVLNANDLSIMALLGNLYSNFCLSVLQKSPNYHRLTCTLSNRKRDVVVLMYDSSSNKFETASHHTFPEDVHCMTEFDGHLCVGMAREYSIIMLDNGDNRSALQLTGTAMGGEANAPPPKPRLAAAGSRVLLWHHNTLFMVSMKHLPAPGQQIRRFIKYPEQPLASVYVHPYVLTFCHNLVYIYSVYNLDKRNNNVALKVPKDEKLTDLFNEPNAFEILRIPGYRHVSPCVMHNTIFCANHNEVCLIRMIPLEYQLRLYVNCFRIEEAFDLIQRAAGVGGYQAMGCRSDTHQTARGATSAGEEGNGAGCGDSHSGVMWKGLFREPTLTLSMISLAAGGGCSAPPSWVLNGYSGPHGGHCGEISDKENGRAIIPEHAGMYQPSAVYYYNALAPSEAGPGLLRYGSNDNINAPLPDVKLSHLEINLNIIAGFAYLYNNCPKESMRHLSRIDVREVLLHLPDLIPRRYSAMIMKKIVMEISSMEIGEESAKDGNAVPQPQSYGYNDSDRDPNFKPILPPGPRALVPPALLPLLVHPDTAEEDAFWRGFMPHHPLNRLRLFYESDEHYWAISSGGSPPANLVQSSGDAESSSEAYPLHFRAPPVPRAGASSVLDKAWRALFFATSDPIPSSGEGGEVLDYSFSDLIDSVSKENAEAVLRYFDANNPSLQVVGRDGRLISLSDDMSLTNNNSFSNYDQRGSHLSNISASRAASPNPSAPAAAGPSNAAANADGRVAVSMAHYTAVAEERLRLELFIWLQSRLPLSPPHQRRAIEHALLVLLLQKDDRRSLYALCASAEFLTTADAWDILSSPDIDWDDEGDPRGSSYYDHYCEENPREDSASEDNTGGYTKGDTCGGQVGAGGRGLQRASSFSYTTSTKPYYSSIAANPRCTDSYSCQSGDSMECPMNLEDSGGNECELPAVFCTSQKSKAERSREANLQCYIMRCAAAGAEWRLLLLLLCRQLGLVSSSSGFEGVYGPVPLNKEAQLFFNTFVSLSGYSAEVLKNKQKERLAKQSAERRQLERSTKLTSLANGKAVSVEYVPSSLPEPQSHTACNSTSNAQQEDSKEGPDAMRPGSVWSAVLLDYIKAAVELFVDSKQGAIAPPFALADLCGGPPEGAWQLGVGPASGGLRKSSPNRPKMPLGPTTTPPRGFMRASIAAIENSVHELFFAVESGDYRYVASVCAIMQEEHRRQLDSEELDQAGTWQQGQQQHCHVRFVVDSEHNNVFHVLAALLVRSLRAGSVGRSEANFKETQEIEKRSKSMASWFDADSDSDSDERDRNVKNGKDIKRSDEPLETAPVPLVDKRVYSTDALMAIFSVLLNYGCTWVHIGGRGSTPLDVTDDPAAENALRGELRSSLLVSLASPASLLLLSTKNKAGVTPLDILEYIPALLVLDPESKQLFAPAHIKTQVPGVGGNGPYDTAALSNFNSTKSLQTAHYFNNTNALNSSHSAKSSFFSNYANTNNAGSTNASTRSLNNGLMTFNSGKIQLATNMNPSDGPTGCLSPFYSQLSNETMGRPSIIERPVMARLYLPTAQPMVQAASAVAIDLITAFALALLRTLTVACPLPNAAPPSTAAEAAPDATAEAGSTT